jgi:4-hydroxy-tetrahydrodipicolinate reductase
VIRVCLAGATGWVGRALAAAIDAAPDLSLVAAVSRSAAGRRLDEVLAAPAPALRIAGTVEEALGTPCDVLVDYTSPSAVRAHALAGIARGAHVVVGTSGLADPDFDAIDAAARTRGVGVLAVGNFALTAVLLERFAAMAARHVGSWEIIDYGIPHKPDAPGSTARQLAARLAAVRAPALGHPLEKTHGAREARGATVSGTQVHSVRLPGFVSSIEILFGLPDERLSIRHDSGSGAGPYVSGTLLAVRKVGALVGLRRGLDAILDS